jgi:hypothetical protein
MRPSGPIADYLAELVRELRFDPALAHRIGGEVEDHLHQAVAEEPVGAGLEAERRVIVRFGDVRELARALAADALHAQARQVTGLMLMAVAAVFLAMKLRVAWYGLTHWTLHDDFRAIYAVALEIDRYAFTTALAVAAAGLTFMGMSPAPHGSRQRYAKRLRRGAALCAIAAAALTLSVGIDAFITGLRLAAAGSTVAAILPTLTVATEVGFAGLLGVNVLSAIRRATGTIELLDV